VEAAKAQNWALETQQREREREREKKLLRALHENEKMCNKPTLQVYYKSGDYEMNPCMLVLITRINPLKTEFLNKFI
jgi:hypothetical protein